MQEHWDWLLDRDGRRARFRSSASDSNRVEVLLQTGERITVPRTLVLTSAEGGYRIAHSFESLLELPEASELTIPVVSEELEFSKREAPGERLRIHTTVQEHTEQANVPLSVEELEVERVKVGREVDAPVAPRQEGDTWIVPVYEEVLHVEKRLVLREEVRVKRVRRNLQQPVQVSLRREQVEVIRSKLRDSS